MDAADTNFLSKAEANGAVQPSYPYNYQDYKRSSGDFEYDDYKKDPSKRATATSAGEPAPFSYGYKGSGKRDSTTAGAREFDYDDYNGRGKSRGATAGARDFDYEDYTGARKRRGAIAGGEAAPFGYSYRRPQKRPGAAIAGEPAPFGYDYKAPSKSHAGSGDSDAASTARAGGAATTTVFFHEEAVRVGERLPFYFPPAAPAALGFLPRRVADSIPFSTPSLPGVLALFGIALDSVVAASMEETLRTCESPTLAGEAKFCASSLEALVELAMATLGTRDVSAVTSTLPRAGAPLQPYTVRAMRPVEGASFLACHDEAYPYTVYRCHTTGPARAYMVEMEGAHGGSVTVATVCHTDTSRWNPEHVSFKLLGTKPGGAPVCHLMPYGHIIWTKNVKRSPA